MFYDILFYQTFENEIINHVIDFQDMQQKYSSKLSAMERHQAETNRRLDDMQSILQKVVTSITSGHGIGYLNSLTARTPSVGDTISTKEGMEAADDALGHRPGSSEQWWSKLD